MDPYLGEIRIFAGNFAPLGWAFCDGQLLPISQYDALFSLLGTTYGGDGQTNFALPDLRGRAPMHMAPSQGYNQGQIGGTEGVTLTAAQFPAHTHTFTASGVAGNAATPQNNVVAGGGQLRLYAQRTPDVSLHPASLGPSTWNGQPYGSNTPQPHANMQPFLCVD